MSSSKRRTFIEPDNADGTKFPDWVSWHFKRFQLPEPEPISKNTDPCKSDKNENNKSITFRKHQQLVAQYLSLNTPFRSLLVYHGLGSGKTFSAINTIITLFQENKLLDVYILIKASLRKSPWDRDLEKLIPKEIKSQLMNRIEIIHYNGPGSSFNLEQVLRKNYSNKSNSIFIIDEIHEFMSSVYNNITNENGMRGLAIYDLIKKFKMKYPDRCWVMGLSATPVVNNPFELALTFNLLQPKTFPDSEEVFESMFIDGSDLNENEKINLFQRRILGLVSYYRGSNPNMFAKKIQHLIHCTLKGHTLKIYNEREEKEEDADRRKQGKFGKRKGIELAGVANKKSSVVDTFYIETRQASNFVSPKISQQINGRTRPKRSEFGASKNMKDTRTSTEIRTADKKFTDAKRSYNKKILFFLLKLRQKDGKKWDKDIDVLKTKYKNNVEKFLESYKFTSKCLDVMFVSSPKMLRICLYTITCKGTVMFYSGFVEMEGVESMRLFLQVFGFGDVESKKKMRYTEYHGSYGSPEKRNKHLEKFNKSENKYGENIKIILISRAGTVGISLANVRQVHILEPHWNEVTISQAIGRAIRDCSHKDLPIEERVVDVYRYIAKREAVLDRGAKPTIDEQIYYNKAVPKAKVLQKFTDAMQSSSFDCSLFKKEHMLENKDSPFQKCFQFDMLSRMNKPTPAYLKNFESDMRMNKGTGVSEVEKRKLFKVKAKQVLGQFKRSEEIIIGYEPTTGFAFDWDLNIIIGKVKKDSQGLPEREDDYYLIRSNVVI